MQRMSKYIRYFTIYDLEENYVWEVEGYKELANWLGKTINNAYSTFSRLKKGRLKTTISNKDNKKYKIYVFIEER